MKYRDEVTKSFKALQTEYERLNGTLAEEKRRNETLTATQQRLEEEIRMLNKTAEDLRKSTEEVDMEKQELATKMNVVNAILFNSSHFISNSKWAR